MIEVGYKPPLGELKQRRTKAFIKGGSKLYFQSYNKNLPRWKGIGLEHHLEPWDNIFFHVNNNNG